MISPPDKLLKLDSIPKTIKTPVLVSWIVTTILIIITAIYYFISQPELPIFYSLARKSDQIVRKEFIFLFPLISLLMNIIHTVVIKIINKYSTLMLELFVFTTALLQIIFLLSLIRIVIITS